MTLDATGRTMRARHAAHTMHGQGRTNTAPARAAFDRKFLDLADPGGTLPAAERERRAGHLRKAYYVKLSAAAAAAKRARHPTPSPGRTAQA